jgi:hypothetical protein
MVDRRLRKSRQILINSFFAPDTSMAEKAATAFPPMVGALRAVSPNYSQLL